MELVGMIQLASQQRVNVSMLFITFITVIRFGDRDWDTWF
jgi:hypothetical protein